AAPWRRGFAIPAIAAPMTGVSTVELVVAACTAGIVGAFPTSNCASLGELHDWLGAIDVARADAPSHGITPGPVAANLIVHRSNTRLDDDLAAVVDHRVPLVRCGQRERLDSPRGRTGARQRVRVRD